MSLKNKLFKELFKMSSAAAQQAGAKAPSHKLSCFNLRHRRAIMDPTQPTNNWKISTEPDPWTTLTNTPATIRSPCQRHFAGPDYPTDKIFTSPRKSHTVDAIHQKDPRGFSLLIMLITCVVQYSLTDASLLTVITQNVRRFCGPPAPSIYCPKWP